jgi:hypothetical protein
MTESVPTARLVATRFEWLAVAAGPLGALLWLFGIFVILPLFVALAMVVAFSYLATVASLGKGSRRGRLRVARFLVAGTALPVVLLVASVVYLVATEGLDYILPLHPLVWLFAPSGAAVVWAIVDWIRRTGGSREEPH